MNLIAATQIRILRRTRGMLCCLITFPVILGVIAFSVGVPAQSRRGAQVQSGQVCFDPTASCRSVASFEPYDLPFRVTKSSVIWESEPFYAIILKSIRAAEGDCEQFISEDERRATQTLFPRRKVFTSRCAEPGRLYYTSTYDKSRFMAVYGGATKAQAARMLEMVKATGKFPGANIRRMRAGFNST
jgi:hypothetical protein